MDKSNIRNHTADFLIFTKENGGNGIEVRIEDETIWLTQKLMAQLFDCTPENVLQHLKKIFDDEELMEEATTKDFLVVREEGSARLSTTTSTLSSPSATASIANVPRLSVSGRRECFATS